MATQKLASGVRGRGHYFSRRRSQDIAVRSIPLALLWYALHAWGLHGIPEVLFGAAGMYVTLYLLDKDFVCRVFR